MNALVSIPNPDADQASLGGPHLAPGVRRERRPQRTVRGDPETRMSEVLDRYGDMADVMENLGVKRVGPCDVRRHRTQSENRRDFDFG